MSSVLVLVLGTLALAAALTPLAYGLLRALFGEPSFPFSRAFDRIAMAVALALLIALRRRFPWGELARHARTWRRRATWGTFLFGLALSMATALAALTIIMTPEHLEWTDRGFAWIALKVLGAVPGALVVAILEESFFRVLVFGKLRASMPALVAAFASSALYAVVHFLSPDRSFVPASASPLVGGEYLAAVFHRLCNSEIVPGLIGLALVGLVLCYAIHQTGSLALCIGLHAGWVIAVKTAVYATHHAPGAAKESELAKRFWLVAQPASWASILLVLLVVHMLRASLASGASAGDASASARRR